MVLVSQMARPRPRGRENSPLSGKPAQAPNLKFELKFEKQVSWKKVGFGLSFLCLSRLGMLEVHSIRPFQTYRKSITKTPKKVL